MALALAPLYPIVDVTESSPLEIGRARSLATTLAEAGITLLQLRAKTLSVGPLTELATELVPALAERGCQLVVNDRIDVALASGAAGVHLGDEDLPIAVARRLLGAQAIIGLSTHSLAEVRAAATCGADYLGFGPVYESPSKPGVRTPRGPAALAEACRASRLPVVAIGGLTLARAPEIWGAGAASAAVISELARADVPQAVVKAWFTAANAVLP